MAPTFRVGRQTGVAFHSYDLSSILNDSNVDRSVNTADVTAYGNTAMSYIAANADGTVSMSGMHHASTARLDHKVADEIGSTSMRPLTWCADGGFTAGRTARLLSGVVTQYNPSAPTNDKTAVSMSVQASSGVWPGVVTHYGAVTATGAQTGVTLNPTGAGSALGGRSHLHVLVDNVTSATFVVQHSSEGVSWSDLHTFTAVSAIGSQIITSTGTVKEQVRLNCSAFTGTSVTVLVATAAY